MCIQSLDNIFTIFFIEGEREMIKKGKKFASLMLALMLVASGCGQTDTEVTDYGQSSGSDSETSVMEESAGKSISDMLGGEELSANKSFSIAGKSATVNVAYTTACACMPS